MSDFNPQSPTFTTLSTDVTGLILSLLPIPSLVRASSVCKSWHSIIFSLPFPPNSISPPWFFLIGLHNTSSAHHQSFAFDPLSDSWICLPPSAVAPPSLHLLGFEKLLFTTAPRFSFSPILKPLWRLTANPGFPRMNPLLGVFLDPCGSFKVILVGGVKFIGGLVDIDEDGLPVEIYDPVLDSWQLCPPLPADFISGNSSQTLSSAIFGGKFYVFGIYSCFISSFCLRTRSWSEVQTLRPPGVLFSFLIACTDMLILGGMCNSPRGSSFNLWKLDEETMEFSEIAILPQNLLYELVDREEDDNKFASLKCVGMGNLIYVFNEEYHKKYPACVCEINGGKFRWRRVPRMPSPVNKFHKVVSFCSTVSIKDVVRHAEDPAQLIGLA